MLVRCTINSNTIGFYPYFHGVMAYSFKTISKVPSASGLIFEGLKDSMQLGTRHSAKGFRAQTPKDQTTAMLSGIFF
jgi:hypothetical protein